MYYVDPAENGGKAPALKKHNFWPLMVPLVCIGFWLVPVAALFGAYVALWIALAGILVVASVGVLALLPVAEGLDTLGVGH